MKKLKFIDWLAIGTVVIGFLFLIAIVFLPIPETGLKYADTVIGFLIGTVLSTVYGFYFGSSLGSRDKDEKENG